jgi:hypothetical protein
VLSGIITAIGGLGLSGCVEEVLNPEIVANRVANPARIFVMLANVSNFSVSSDQLCNIGIKITSNAHNSHVAETGNTKR